MSGPAARPLRDDLEEALARRPATWEALRGARVFLTGATGFYGAWLVESFAWAVERLGLGAEAVLLTRDPAGFLARHPHLGGHPALGFHAGDVRTFAPPAGRFTHVVHAAAPSSPALRPDDLAHRDPEVLRETVVLGTQRVLALARASGAPRVLFASSGAVYGRQPADLERVPEDHPGAPDTMDPGASYGHAKRDGEHLCALAWARHGVPAVVTRGFAFLGPHLPLDVHFAAGNFLRDGLAGGPIRVSGDGTPYRSYLYASDLAVWLWTLLVAGTPGRAYNVGSERGMPLGDVAREVGAHFGAAVTIARTPTPGALPSRYVPSTARAREELGLAEWVPLRDAIARTARWHQRG